MHNMLSIDCHMDTIFLQFRQTHWQQTPGELIHTREKHLPLVHTVLCLLPQDWISMSSIFAHVCVCGTSMQVKQGESLKV